MPIFATGLNRITIRVSIVGTSQDFVECLEFAREGTAHAHYDWEPLDAINDIFTRLEAGRVDGRIVMRI